MNATKSYNKSIPITILRGMIGHFVFIIYSSIMHAAYVTRMLYRVIMYAAYGTRLSGRNFLTFYKRNKKLSPRALLSYISTWEFLRTLGKFVKHSAAPSASLCTSLVFIKLSACLYNSIMHSGAFFSAATITITTTTHFF